MYKKNLSILSVAIGISLLVSACSKNDNDLTDNNGTTPPPTPTSVNFLDNVKTSLDSKLIYSQSVQLIRNSVMQCFDVDSKGDLYYNQVGGLLEHALFIMKGKANKPYQTSMQINYFGHGTNMAVEEDGDKRYIWIGSVGYKKNDGTYGSNRTFSRFLYTPDQTLEHYAGETYYLPNKINIHPALDIENNLLAVTTSGGGDPLRYFYIYSLSEARNITPSKVSFPEIRFGGGTSGVPEQTKDLSIQVKDLSKLKAIASFAVRTGANVSQLNSLAFQGFDIDGQYIYFYEGEGNANTVQSGSSEAYVTVLNYRGQAVGSRTKVQALVNISKLEQLGITNTGYMEAEGIKVKKDSLYLGFASKGTDDIRRANVLKYLINRD